MNARTLMKNALKAAIGSERYRKLRMFVHTAAMPPDTPALNPPNGLRLYRSPYHSVVAEDNFLEDLGAKYKPSKRHHNYLQYYWMHFRDIRLQVRTMCEIGVQTDNSIRMWEEFFPNAAIYGLDIDRACQQYEGGRRRILIGDQSDPEVLAKLLGEVEGRLDLVIDDGSHNVSHQLFSFDTLFPHLSDHGVYVIEDTGGVVGDTDLITVNALKKLIDHVMYWPPGVDPADWGYVSSFPGAASWGDRNIMGLAFYRWIVFIFRGRNPQDNPYLMAKT